jgi:hypothetical protein
LNTQVSNYDKIHIFVFFGPLRRGSETVGCMFSMNTVIFNNSGTRFFSKVRLVFRSFVVGTIHQLPLTKDLGKDGLLALASKFIR